MGEQENKLGIERRRLTSEDQYKYLDRKSTFRIDFRQRIDLFAKTVLVTTGGALTISMTLFLKDDAPVLNPEHLVQLKCTWFFLLYTLCSFSLGLFLMLIQGLYVNKNWDGKIPLSDDQITGNKVMTTFRWVILSLGASGFFFFLYGLVSLGLVAVEVLSLNVASH